MISWGLTYSKLQDDRSSHSLPREASECLVTTWDLACGTCTISKIHQKAKTLPWKEFNIIPYQVSVWLDKIGKISFGIIKWNSNKLRLSNIVYMCISILSHWNTKMCNTFNLWKKTYWILIIFIIKELWSLLKTSRILRRNNQQALLWHVLLIWKHGAVTQFTITSLNSCHFNDLMPFSGRKFCVLQISILSTMATAFTSKSRKSNNENVWWEINRHDETIQKPAIQFSGWQHYLQSWAGNMRTERWCLLSIFFLRFAILRNKLVIKRMKFVSLFRYLN